MKILSQKINMEPETTSCVPGCDCHDIGLDSKFGHDLALRSHATESSHLRAGRLHVQLHEESHLQDEPHWLVLHLQSETKEF
ncbi:hypothetical protein MSG28_009315 [Choristoneura fumiferana]|uniref:Uncharacterized protein n=1 Tax=Choristoneura fumiferana TaxID=7141 RepID=A0ACC0KXG2_CHOFU|nr:hypothetical protein MSG28_009315 [Choristoneura fumiferana]